MALGPPLDPHLPPSDLDPPPPHPTFDDHGMARMPCSDHIRGLPSPSLPPFPLAPLLDAVPKGCAPLLSLGDMQGSRGNSARRRPLEEKWEEPEPPRAQHNQLRRGDGAEQGASDKDANAKRGEKDRHQISGGTQLAGSGRGQHWQSSL